MAWAKAFCGKVGIFFVCLEFKIRERLPKREVAGSSCASPGLVWGVYKGAVKMPLAQYSAIVHHCFPRPFHFLFSDLNRPRGSAANPPRRMDLLSGQNFLRSSASLTSFLLHYSGEHGGFPVYEQ